MEVTHTTDLNLFSLFTEHFIQVDDYTLINEQVTRKKRLAVNIWEWLWIGGIIPYGISSSYSGESTIHK